MTELYDTLGVDPEATPAEIKAAYRRRAAETHPDKGGTPDAFRAVAVAYEVLGDEHARQYYDDHGKQEPTDKEIHKAAVKLIIREFMAAIGKVHDISTQNVIEYTVAAFHECLRSCERATKEAEKNIAKLESVATRLHCKDANDFIGAAVNAARANVRLSMAGIEETAELANAALDILEHYDYATDDPNQAIRNLLNGTTPAGVWVSINQQ